jgi:hypothetical protein
MLNGKSGMMTVLRLKQLLSLLLIEVATLRLVPPDPLAKPVLSLTYILVSLYTRRVASEETHHGDELGCG